MEDRSLKRSLDAMLVAYSLVPTSFLVAFSSFVVRARIELGRWPTPMQPDPKSLPFADTHMDWVFWLFVFTICCFVPWLLMLIFRKQWIPQTRFFPTIIVLCLPWLLVAVDFFLDPGGYVEWFLD